MAEQRALGQAHVLGDRGGGDLPRVVAGGQRDHRIHGGGAALFGRGLVGADRQHLAFTVCFMVWMMFGVIGIPIKKTLNLNATAVRPADGHAGAHRLADPRAAGHLDRQVRRPHRDGAADGATVPAIWLMSYATEYWHFLTIGLFVGLAGGSFSVGTPYVARWFPKKPPGHGHGRVRRRQLGRGGQQVRRAGAAGGLRLDHGAAGLRRHHAGHRDAVLAVQHSDPASTWCPAT
jgi:hypothetical protein